MPSCDQCCIEQCKAGGRLWNNGFPPGKCEEFCSAYQECSPNCSGKPPPTPGSGAPAVCPMPSEPQPKWGWAGELAMGMSGATAGLTKARNDMNAYTSEVGWGLVQGGATAATIFAPAVGRSAALIDGALPVNITVLYHYTSAEAAALIRTSGILAGRRGLFGSGVYGTKVRSPLVATLMGAKSTEVCVPFTTKGLELARTLIILSSRIKGNVPVINLLP